MADAEEEEQYDEEEEEEEEDIPLEQKLKICNFFVGATCAGEQPKVVENLQHFLKEYDDDSVLQHLINRAENCCQIVDGTIISDVTKSGDGYINATKGKVMTLSMKNKMLAAEEGEDAESSEGASALQKELEKYIDSNYHQDASKAVAVVDGDEGMNVIISADRINLSNYWSGQMCSRWTISEDGGVSGTITLKLHYFEGGNVMFDAKKDTKWDGAASKEPKDIKKAIATLETEYQQAWADYFGSQDKSIMSVRRALTMQKTKFDWRLSQATMVQALG